MRGPSPLPFVAALAACGGSEADHVDYDTVAQIVGSTVATPEGGGTVGALRDSIALAFGHAPDGFGDHGGMMGGPHGGMDHEYMMVACRDRDGRLLARCDGTTDTATVIVKWSGDVRQPDFDLASTRQGTWTLGGLQHMSSWLPTVTGNSQVEGDARFAGDGHYTLSVDETEAMVAPGPPSMHLDVDVTRGDAALHVGADVIFDGADLALLALDDMVSYRIDLNTGRVEQVMR